MSLVILLTLVALAGTLLPALTSDPKLLTALPSSKITAPSSMILSLYAEKPVVSVSKAI
jgi:hypothetical protein